MEAGVEDVLAGRKRWHVATADCIEFLKSLPDDSLDLLFTSPPYLEARTYGIGAGRKLEPWVEWMKELVTVASAKAKGLIAINCEGQTRGFRYLPAPFLLMADLHRAGFNLRKPVVFQRMGIMGSGGPDWLRNDYEPVVCVSRPGRLPWAQPTACGKPPKYQPGGEISHRNTTGERVNSRATKKVTGSVEPQVAAAIAGELEIPAGSRLTNTTRPDGTTRRKLYKPPEIANPGNVIKCLVGGGRMGHEAAHENEAPFPLKLAEFFVKSFCPPDGITCDPFSGSGTVLHACHENGRRFVGCDIRESQVSLAERRVMTVTPSLFAGD